MCATGVCRDIDGPGALARFPCRDGHHRWGKVWDRPVTRSACAVTACASFSAATRNCGEATRVVLPGEGSDGLGDGSRAGRGEQDRVVVRAWHVGDRGLRRQSGDGVAELVRDDRIAGAGQAAGSAQQQQRDGHLLEAFGHGGGVQAVAQVRSQAVGQAIGDKRQDLAFSEAEVVGSCWPAARRLAAARRRAGQRRSSRRGRRPTRAACIRCTRRCVLLSAMAQHARKPAGPAVADQHPSSGGWYYPSGPVC